jgi:hypothetical protein
VALVDFAVHMLAGLLDWFGPVTSFDYQDDDWGSGIGANLLLDTNHADRCGDIPGHLRMSRTFGLKNQLLARGTAASAEMGRDRS